MGRKTHSGRKTARSMAAVVIGGSIVVTAGLGLASPMASFAAPAAPTALAATASEYLVTDNYLDLDGWLENLGDAATVKVTAISVGTGKTVLPKQVTLLTGWSKNFVEDTEAVRQLGYGGSSDSFTFQEGSNATVRSIEFKLADDKLVIPSGTSIAFENVTFSNRIVIENGASATFKDCTFESGTIKNEGKASYTGSTEEPRNTATPETQFQSLGLAIPDAALDDAAADTVWAVNGKELDRTIGLTVTGTRADDARLSASAEGVDGLTASIEGGKVHLAGTPRGTGTATVTVEATAPTEDGTGNEKASATLRVEVNAKLSLALSGKLDPVRTGQGDYQDTKYHEVEMRVTEDGGRAVDFATWRDGHAGAQVSSSISPKGSGLRTAFWNAGGNSSISVSGTAEAAGTYRVTASLTYKGQTVTAESGALRIYEGNETLAGQLADIAGQPGTWQMEPYEIWRSDDAVIPTWLHRITGSDESGLYGQIGNNGRDGGTDAFASDTLTVPAGADVTLENIKVNSSVKIVVEKGGRLTLLDSVAYGPIEVNGGTLRIQRDDVRHSGVTSTITLNDGSTLEDSQVISNAVYLTDGRTPAPATPEAPVIVNGNVTFKGENTIEGDEGQDALRVNGVATIPSGSSLTATGGDSGVASPEAGTGMQMADGTVTGGGSLTAIGGSNKGIVFGGSPGKAVAGTGAISTGTFTAKGGDGGGYATERIDGADAGEKGVWVSVAEGAYDIAGGTSDTGKEGIGKDSFSWGRKPGQQNGQQGNGGNRGESGEGGTREPGANSREDDADGTQGGSESGRLPQTGDGSAAVTTAVLAGGIALSTAGATLLRRERRR